MSLSKARMKELSQQRRDAKRQTYDKPKPDWLLNPNRYLLGHLRVCPDYNPEAPQDHWERCLYVNPMLRGL